MAYEEKQIGTATTVNELIIPLCNEDIPRGAAVDVASSYHCTDAKMQKYGMMKVLIPSFKNKLNYIN